MNTQYSKIQEMDYKMKYLLAKLGDMYYYYLGTMVMEDGFSIVDAIELMWQNFGEKLDKSEINY